MKHFVIITLLLLTLGETQAQPSQAQQDQAKLLQIKDSIEQYVTAQRADIYNDSINDDFFSDKALRSYFDRYFTLINYERETFTDGNSAALKITDNHTRLNLTLSKKFKKSILSMGTALNISDNSGTLFTGSKPTAGTQFFINNSLLLPVKKLMYDDGYRFANYKARRDILDSIYAVHVKKNPNSIPVLNAKLIKQSALITAYDSVLAIYSPVNTAAARDSVLKYQELLTTAVGAREKLVAELKAIEVRKDVEDIVKEIRAGTESRSIQRETATDGVTSFRLSWFSYGFSYRKDTYKTYDADLPLSERIGEKQFDGFSFTTGFNFYFQRNPMWINFANKRFFNSIYANINYSAAYDNTFAALKETSLTIIKNTVSNDTVYQFSSTEKLRDVTDKAFKRYFVHKVGFQFTGMMGKKQFWGVNITGNSGVSAEEDPVYNLRTGILFRFLDSADQKSKVNFEIFLGLNDLSDTKETDKSAWKRREIGISASVPFQKVFFK
jgi:hypothetical protein